MARNQNIDLAFVMDCTSSMSSYIKSAKENINKIADELIRSEKCRLRIALVQYRDHPPQDRTFVTKINNFTDDIKVSKKFISSASAQGGGDFPESICCAVYDCLNNLNWDANSIKVAILIADAPPHGLIGAAGDSMPEGCPKKNDPVEIANKMAERSITLYCVGCEPSLKGYRSFFQTIALITGGKYVPLDRAENLSEAIIGGTREEVSMEKLMAQVHNEVMKEAADKGEAVNEDVLTKRIHELLNKQGSKANKLKIENSEDLEITDDIKEMSKLKNLKEINKYMKDHNISLGTTFTTPSGLFGSTTITAMPLSSSLFGSTPPLLLSSATTPLKDDKPVKRVSTHGKKRASDEATSSSKEKKAKKSDDKPAPRKGVRRSTRLAFNSKEDALKYIAETGGDTDVDESDAEEEIPKTKPSLTKKASSVSLSADETVDIDQARRLVKKSIARIRNNKK